MRRLRSVILSLIILGILPGWIFAAIEIDLTLLNTQARVFYVGDLDFTKTGNAPDIFRLSIRNTTSEPEPIVLEIRILYNGRVLGKGETNDFTIPGNNNQYYRDIIITQSDLLKGALFIRGPEGRLQKVYLKRYELDINQLEDLKNKILSTGRLPSGRYQFEIRARSLKNPGVVYSESPAQLGDNTLFITNPTNVQLIFPGRPTGDPNIPTISTIYPYFQWQSDANVFNIYVYEKRAEDRNVQDALSHPPILFIEGYTLDPDQRQYLFQYPTSTQPIQFANGGRSVGPIRLLEPGKIYYWYIEAVVPTGSGDNQIIKSEVYHFKIQERVPQNSQARQIMTMLQNLGGDALLQQIKLLKEQGYEPTGKVRLNGREIDLTEFIRYMNQLQGTQSKIGKISIY
ncbi:MAG: hypothetical protein GXO78_03385 [Calditrichaeota bacterium]|nr:hypothetical protein [Calditrichota bacterium]